MLTCTKTYSDIPFAHRAHNHDGHCKLLHGHNWSFVITFGAVKTDECGFVVDFGKLKGLKAQLDELFDHKLVLNETDPLAPDIARFLRGCELGNVTMVPDCSCEGIARLVFKIADKFVREDTLGRVHVVAVTVYEDSKNTATYQG